MPSTHMLIPYFEIVYATCSLNHRGSRLSGGDSVRMCGLRPASAERCKCGRHACEQRNVPRTLMPNIRSKRFIGVAAVPVRLIALALLTRMSMPPNASTAAATADRTAASSRMSQTIGSALPPASVIC